MPKTKLQEYVSRLKNPEPEVPKPNYLRELFKRYMKTQNISADTIGENLNCSGSNIRHMMNKESSDWKIGDIEKMMKETNCPGHEILRALSLSLNIS